MLSINLPSVLVFLNFILPNTSNLLKAYHLYRFSHLYFHLFIFYILLISGYLLVVLDILASQFIRNISHGNNIQDL